MTEIAFHFNAPGKLDYTCRLLRKAAGRGAHVVVTADADSLGKLDQLLWTFSALDFIPHCRADGDATVVAASPVVLASALDSLARRDILLTLGDEVPAGFESFGRLIEVVSLDEDDRAGARRRWKHYADRGYTLVRHDLASAGAGA